MFDVSKRMKEYLIGVVLGLLAGALLYFVQPVQWKGQALVRVGQISQSQSQSQGQGQNIYSIEPLSTVVERLKSRSFVLAVAKRAKRSEIVGLLDEDKGSGLTIKPIRNSDSLTISVVGGSPELVQTTIDSIVAELISTHDAILDAYQADIRKELSRLDSEITILSKRIAMIPDCKTATSCKPAEGGGLVAGFAIMTMQHDLENKMKRSSELRESISSANIRPTSLVEPTSISEQRIFFTLSRACLFGALLGIFLSLLWIRWKK
ncbi:MAG: hypothetical protein HY052_08450 [Proteobacteria bacterium]|nr:hypothetical protein [Pseudomonadota bacterium]